MNNQNYLIDAIETVLSWDIAEELIPLAINDQVKLMAGFDAEEVWSDDALFNLSLGSNLHLYN